MKPTAHPRDIFIVCNNIEELGGLQRWAHHVAGLFAASGHDVHLIGVVHPQEVHQYGRDLPYRTTVLHDEHPPSAWSPKRLRDRLNVQAQAREQRRRADVQAAADRLTSLFRQARPGGIVIVPQVWAMEWVALSDPGKLRVIGMSHESFQASQASSRFGRVKRYFSDVDLLLLLTQEDADEWVANGMNNTGAMPNPLPITPEITADRSAKTVVSLGRLSFEKGYDLLLTAWSHVAPRHPDWTLRLFGSGPEADNLRKQAAELGVSGSVEFPGQTADIEGALRDASVFALASRAEGFPMSLLEAMAMGLPCAAFDCAPGVREIVDDGGNGFLLTPGNTAGLADALERLITDRDLRETLGDQARVDVQQFSADAILDRWESVFQHLYR
ncbi:MAG: glycosyltransferase family 4 protein [Streptomycetaceae bacterium]|nr:glycosyltransferase family 4 protein [Streptomycetaceae bacterium]